MSRAGFAMVVMAALARGGAQAPDFSDIKLERDRQGFHLYGGAGLVAEGWIPDLQRYPGRPPLEMGAGPTRSSFFVPMRTGPSGNAFDSEGRLYTCETRTRRVTRTDKKGAIEVLAEKWEGKRLNAPNDIVVSRSGHVYFTDPAFGWQSDQRELDFYGVYHIPPKGAMRLVAKPAGRPNGIALSPNGRILYVVNADERNVRAYDLDRNGDASNERV